MVKPSLFVDCSAFGLPSFSSIFYEIFCFKNNEKLWNVAISKFSELRCFPPAFHRIEALTTTCTPSLIADQARKQGGDPVNFNKTGSLELIMLWHTEY